MQKTNFLAAMPSNKSKPSTICPQILQTGILIPLTLIRLYMWFLLFSHGTPDEISRHTGWGLLIYTMFSRWKMTPDAAKFHDDHMWKDRRSLECEWYIRIFIYSNFSYRFCIGGTEMALTFPICISFSTKFWVYLTSFFFFWPVISSNFAKVWFLIFTSGMFYFFYKAMKSDPGIITTQQEQKKRVSRWYYQFHFISILVVEDWTEVNYCSLGLLLEPWSCLYSRLNIAYWNLILHFLWGMISCWW